MGMKDPRKLTQDLRVFLENCVWEIHCHLHISAKGLQFGSRFFPHQDMKIPSAKAAEDKEWEKLEKISAWNLTKVRGKKE